MNKIILLILIAFSSSQSIAHFPDTMTCKPMLRVTCISNTNTDPMSNGCDSEQPSEDIESFELLSEKQENERIYYKMPTSWLGLPLLLTESQVDLIDLDGSETFQQGERFFIAPKLGGYDQGFLDTDISGSAVISGTGHPHNLVFDFTKNENMGMVTVIGYANCVE